MRFNKKEIKILITQSYHYYLDEKYVELLFNELNLFLNLLQEMKKFNEDLICNYVKEDICDIENKKLEIERILFVLNKYKKILKVIINKIDKIMLYLSFLTVEEKSIYKVKDILNNVLNVFMELILLQENFLFLLGKNKKILNLEIKELKKILNYINDNIEKSFEVVVNNFDYYNFIFNHEFFKLLKNFKKKLKEL